MPTATEAVKLVKSVSPKLKLSQAANIISTVSKNYDTMGDKKGARRILLRAANDVIAAIDELDALE